MNENINVNVPPPNHVMVLDGQGWVGLVDQMGTETSIVNAARVSFGKRKEEMDARDAGLDGVVCSPLEAGAVHAACGDAFLTVTPGVRFADGATGDQQRVTTPARARELGSDFIVVGRPITASPDPVAAYERCVREFLGE